MNVDELEPVNKKTAPCRFELDAGGGFFAFPDLFLFSDLCLAALAFSFSSSPAASLFRFPVSASSFPFFAKQPLGF